MILAARRRWETRATIGLEGSNHDQSLDGGAMIALSLIIWEMILRDAVSLKPR